MTKIGPAFNIILYEMICTMILGSIKEQEVVLKIFFCRGEYLLDNGYQNRYLETKGLIFTIS